MDHAAPGRLWVRLMKRHRVERDATVPIPGEPGKTRPAVPMREKSEDGIVVPLMAIGAIGVISVWSNVAPADVHDMCAAFSAGDLLRARELQLKAQPLVDALFSEVNPIPVKKALNLMGLEVGPLRSPLTEMTPENAAKLAEAMKNYGIKLA